VIAVSVLSVVDSYSESAGTVADTGDGDLTVDDEVVVDDGAHDDGETMMQSSMSMQHQQHRMLLPSLQRRWPELIVKKKQ